MAKTILLVEDIKANRLNAASRLEKSHFSVLAVANEEEARKEAARNRIDLVIIDLNLLPNRKGGEGAGLRLLGALPREIPKIIWSGVEDDPKVVRDAFDQPEPAFRPKTYVFKSEGYDALVDKVRVVLSEEQRLAEERQREEARRQQESDRLATAEKTVTELQGIIQRDIVARQSRTRTAKRWLKGMSLLLGALITLGLFLALFNPRFISEELATNPMFSELVASLAVLLMTNMVWIAYLTLKKKD